LDREGCNFQQAYRRPSTDSDLSPAVAAVADVSKATAPIGVDLKPRLLRYAEAAAILGVSLGLVKREVLAGRIRSVRIATARRIPADEIDRVVSEGLPGHASARQSERLRA
jgi:excisionase family DNA binding protein